MTRVDVVDPDGNPAVVTYESFVEVWSDLGYELVGEPGQTDAPVYADPDEQDKYGELFDTGKV